MSGRVEEPERPAGEVEHHSVRGLNDPVGRYADRIAIRALDLGLAVDRARAGHQPRRVHQVRRSARMHDEARPWQLRKQQSGPAGMVEVHMGRNHEVDRVQREADGVDRIEQAWDRMVGAGVDERAAAVLDDQVARIEARAEKAGVDDMDAVIEQLDEVGQRRHGGKRVGEASWPPVATVPVRIPSSSLAPAPCSFFFEVSSRWRSPH